MSFLFGARSQQPNRLGSIQVQTSELGVPIPYAAGSVKAPFKLLDYVDFVAHTQQEQGGKGGGGVTSYDYTSAIDAALCEGPIDGIGNIYDSSGTSASLQTVEYFLLPYVTGSYTPIHHGNDFQLDEGVTYSQTYSVVANDYGSDGTTTISGTQSVPMAKVSGSPGAGQYSVDLTTGVYTFSAADGGKTVAISYTYINNNTNPNPASKYNLGVMLGTYPQGPWGYMSSRHPDRALGYDGIARATSESFDLGSAATPPNLNVEVLNARGLKFGGGVADCDPARVILDICNGAHAGMGWPYLGDTTLYSNFCVANSLLISMFLDSQQKALSLLDNITKLTNSAPVWSGAALKLIPYGDTTAVGNGRTFQPNTEPIYEIDYSDMIAQAGEEPVKSSWPDLADNYNSIQFQYTRRDHSYNNDVINEKDEASILMHGELPAQTVDGSLFCVTNYASMAANMLLKRAAVPLRQHSFTLKWFYFLLEPMDIILLQRKRGGPYIPVRIVSVTENDDYSLDMVAEDFLYRVANGVQYPKGSGNGNNRGAHDLPGNTSVLSLFQPTTRLTNGANQAWMAMSGGSSWGGCYVMMSLDNGTTYRQIATQYGPARAGMLTNGLAQGSDPDTTHTLSVSINGTLGSGTQADADSYATLCLAGNELISYETATLTGSSAGSNSYDLTYLRRGIFSNNSQAHSAGEQFVRLDDQITKYTFDPSLIGKTVYFKFVSFNLYELEPQDITTLNAYAFIVGGSSAAQNMQITAALESGGTTAAVYVSRQGYPGGTAGSGTLNNGAVVTLPAQTFTGRATSTFYAVNWNPVNSTYVIYTDSNAWLADQTAGMLGIGGVTTPAAGGGGGGGTSFVPTSYTDTGQNLTSRPDGAYNPANAPATVTGYATSMFWSPSRPIDNQSKNGVCSWQGFAGVTPSAMNLHVTVQVTFNYDGFTGSGYAQVQYTLDGSTWSPLCSFANVSTFSQTFTAAVPSGTDISQVQVQAQAYASVTDASSGSPDNEASMAIDVSAINIS